MGIGECKNGGKRICEKHVVPIGVVPARLLDPASGRGVTWVCLALHVVGE